MTSGSDPARWRRLKELFGAAVDLGPDRRATYLAEACSDDSALRQEVETLLEAASGEGAFDALHRAFTPVPDSGEPFEPPGGLSHYDELKLVGAGGMGVVYRARDRLLHRRVALKFLPAGAVSDQATKERFLVEARAVAALDHPNVCAIHEIGETGEGRLFLAMPFYEGETLRERIERGPVPLKEAVSILSQVCQGLAAAHSRGILHRDIKPANVLITLDGGVRILDFGIAKLSGVEITRPGQRLGSLAYASPEQLRGEAVDFRTDVWSVGVTLYETLTGVRPFPGDDEAALTTAILGRDPVPLARQRPDLPPALGDMLTRALARDPGNRYPSIAEFARDLQLLSGGMVAPGAARGPGRELRRTRRRTPLVAAVVVAGSIAIGVTLGNRDRGRSAATGPIAVAVMPLEWLGVGNDRVIADAIHSELVTSLSKVSALRVVSRMSVLAYRGSGKSDRDIARELGVFYMVEGGVRQEGQRIRVDIRVNQPSTPRVLWGDSFDAEPSTVALYTTLTRIVKGVLSSLGASPTPEERARVERAYPTANLSAYVLFYRAVAAFDGTLAGNRETERLLRLALAADSSYAEAWATLAIHFAWRPLWTGLPTSYWDSALVTANRARALEPTNDDAPLAELIVRLYQGFLGQAERIARQTLRLDPSSDGAMRHLALSVQEQGRLDEALPLHQSAVRLSPQNIVYRASIGYTYLSLGDTVAAERVYREVLVLQPDFWAGLEGLAMVALQRGQRDSMLGLAGREATAYADDPAAQAAAAMIALYAGEPQVAAGYARRAEELSSGPISSWDMLGTTILGYSRLVDGDSASADSLFRVSLSFLDDRIRQGAEWYRWTYEVALIQAVRGHRQAALEGLERAAGQGLRSRWMLTDHPMLQSVRAEPRFVRLVARVDSAVAVMRQRIGPNSASGRSVDGSRLLVARRDSRRRGGRRSPGRREVHALRPMRRSLASLG